jgi:hypothetical protein
VQLFTRRRVLMLAGAAGVVPFVGVSAGGATLTSVVQNASLVINDGLVIRNLADGTVLTSGGTIPVTYFKDTTANTYYCRLPWAHHMALAGPLIGAGMNLPVHTFTFDKLVVNKATAPVAAKNVLHHIRVTADINGLPGPACCIMCGDYEVCVPSGHSYICNGIQYSCP